MGNATKKKIMFVGGGNMAQALITGLLSRNFNPAYITISDPHIQSNQQMMDKGVIGINPASPDVRKAVKEADVVLLAVKPQVMQKAVADFHRVLDRQLVISIAAGLSTQSLSQFLGGYKNIVRAMPNTPATILKGATGLFAMAHVNEKERQLASDVMAASGLVIWLEEEAQLHAVTAISGSAPAYFFYMIESMTKAGVQLGLDEKQASALAMQTALGSAHMAIASSESPAQLRRKVTSPNGTTQAAVASLQQDDFGRIVFNAMQACYQRSEDISQDLSV